MFVSVIHPGTQHAFRIAEELFCRQLLFGFWTSVGFANTDWRLKFLERLAPKLRRKLDNRVSKVIGSEAITSLMRPVLIEQTRSRLSLTQKCYYKRRNDRFQGAVPNRVFERSDYILGMDTSSRLIAQRTRKAGKIFVLDQTIGHSLAQREELRNVRDRFPAWATAIPEKPLMEIEQESQEHDLAHVVLAPSSFVARTLIENGVPAAKIKINPYGTDCTRFHPPEKPRSTDILKFLFVGGLTARKGIPDILEAWRLADLKAAELWIAGGGDVPESERFNSKSNVKWLGRKSRAETADLMQQANVFVLPSYFEGLALVQIEALASGLPVIGTYESGASDLVDDGINGFIVPKGNPDFLANLMTRLNADRQLVSTLEWNILQGSKDYSWQAYTDRWIEQVTLTGHSP